MEKEEDILQFKKIVDSYNGIPRLIVYFNGKNYGSVSSNRGDDLKGMCLEKFIKRRFMAKIRDIDANGIEGFAFYDVHTGSYYDQYQPNFKIKLDGREGFSEMEKVLERLGYKLVFYKEGKTSVWYKMKRINGSKKNF